MIHMTVQVLTDTRNTAAHDEADRIEQNEGHLLVRTTGSPSKIVAIYAPGRWLSAKVAEGDKA